VSTGVGVPSREAQERGEAFLVELAALCDRHGVSLFFGDRYAELWAKGERVGAIADTEWRPGACFELLESVPSETPRPARGDAAEGPR